MGYPQVQKDQVRGFAKAWNHNGIKLILDDSTLQFAVDFANVVLRSFVDDMKKSAAKAQPSQPANAVAGSTVLPTVPAPKPSGIIITG